MEEKGLTTRIIIDPKIMIGKPTIRVKNNCGPDSKSTCGRYKHR